MTTSYRALVASQACQEAELVPTWTVVLLALFFIVTGCLMGFGAWKEKDAGYRLVPYTLALSAVVFLIVGVLVLRMV